MRGTWGATKPGASIQIEEDFEPGCQECSGRERGCAYDHKTWTIVIAGRTKQEGPQVSPPQATRRLLGMTWFFDQLTEDFQAFWRTGSRTDVGKMAATTPLIQNLESRFRHWRGLESSQ